MNDELIDRLLIREAVENWVLWRDRGDWAHFRTIWHSDGMMTATWFRGGFEQFMEGSQAGFDKGMHVLHFLGGSTIEVRGDRGTAETKMTINQRARVGGVICDVVCMGRSYDLFERRSGKWGLVLRQHIYDKDRLDPLEPGGLPEIDSALLERFPEGYRHLGYVQASAGLEVRTDLPCSGSAEAGAVLQQGEHWLSGGAIEES